MQVKLLRVIQDREFTRVGGTEQIKVDVRIISASNKDLEEAVREKKFREDLYYRLNVIQIKLPLLRERREDIPVLAEHFFKKYAQELNKDIREISPDAMKLLVNYDYPGNVRELQNIIERGVALEINNTLTVENLESYIDEQRGIKRIDETLFDIPTEGIDLETVVGDLERNLLIKALQRAKGVKKKAAELLNINFRSMRYRLEKYGLNIRD
jgi:two-component system response regulator PilR (NtrC family)